MDSRNRVKSPAIARLLLEWFHAGHRDLPWRRTSDPYRIWVSEIMLQQTRAQAVIPYYERFLARFPDIASLAAAPEGEVLALWSGLGYYSRARNLRTAAAHAMAAGGFPTDYPGIRALPGIGDYTAAAIASIAFGLPYAVVDGNVLRVVARVQNDAADIAAPRTRERFREIAQSWLEEIMPDRRAPGAFNQALMELGATICLPRKPMCLLCPLAKCCRGHQEATAAQLPVKLRKIAPVKIEGVLLVVRRGQRILLRQRATDARRMAGFWDLPSPEDLPNARTGRPFGVIRHSITHHRYRFTVLPAKARFRGAGYAWFEPSELSGIPLSTTARKALRLTVFTSCDSFVKP